LRGGMFAPRMTHARRQQYRHRIRGIGYAVSAAVISLVAVGAARSGQDAPTVFALLLLVAAVCWAAGRSQRLAQRWRVGADSERAVQHALKELAGSGWVVRNGVRWPGGGDIDHLVRSPDGVGFAVETKTRTFSDAHVRRTVATARWAARRRRRYPGGVVPVLCVVRANRVESHCGGVMVVSLDRLLAALESTAMSACRSARPGGRRWTNRGVRGIEPLGLNPIRDRVAGRNDG
jgi:Nuclease-related domain